MVSRTSPVAEQIDAILNNKVLNFTVVNGAAAATNIAVTGIATSDKIVSAVKLDFTLAEGRAEHPHLGGVRFDVRGVHNLGGQHPAQHHGHVERSPSGLLAGHYVVKHTLCHWYENVIVRSRATKNLSDLLRFFAPLRMTASKFR